MSRLKLFQIKTLCLVGLVLSMGAANISIASPFEMSPSEIYTRFVAKEYCSCRFVVQQTEAVCRNEAKAFAALIRVQEDNESKLIKAINHFSSAEAYFQDERVGCQLSDHSSFQAQNVPPNSIEVQFGEEIETCHSREVLWEQLSQSAMNSERTWLWPNRRSVMRGEGLFNGAQAIVTYKSFWSNFSYGYEIANVVPGYQFEYIAGSDHAFVGGATVRIIEDENEQTSLSWKGTYWIPRSNSSGRRFFQSFSENFFRDLRINLQRNC